MTADPTADAVAELIAGLAWTAACGDTCVLTGPVADVRRAVEALRAGDEATARATLDAALRALRAIPVRHHH
ncbi:hypothetical protein [Actinokineospora sp.]|uniref:hypothetical protein n=1 Tax=Actinokineospora sp. TaxID=1872133 RepID=UPI004038344D